MIGHLIVGSFALPRGEGADGAALDRIQKQKPRPAEAAHHGSHGHAQDIRRLAIAEAGEIDQFDDLAMQRIEAFQCLSDGDRGNDPIVMPPLLVLKRLLGSERADRAAAMLVDPDIAQDREEPGPDALPFFRR